MPLFPPPPGASGGGALGSAELNPGVQVNATTTSSTLTLIDAALVVSFTVPASGRVLVQCSALGIVAGSVLVWGVLDAADTPLTASLPFICNINSSPTRVTSNIRLTGLTPGAAYTVKWAHKNLDNIANVYTEYGGAAGPAVITVFSLP